MTVDFVDPERWIVGGRSLADQGKTSFWLDIKVVDGTNTKDEKAAFVAAILPSETKTSSVRSPAVPTNAISRPPGSTNERANARRC